jgi:hypothetical protein
MARRKASEWPMAGSFLISANVGLVSMVAALDSTGQCETGNALAPAVRRQVFRDI